MKTITLGGKEYQILSLLAEKDCDTAEKKLYLRVRSESCEFAVDPLPMLGKGVLPPSIENRVCFWYDDFVLGVSENQSSSSLTSGSASIT
ncbi:MAG: hypothetical protein JKX76_03260 [Colwellia sp.]|nr:hypothetical protein [Colwellia sp.]